jgi:hypothetical protein
MGGLDEESHAKTGKRGMKKKKYKESRREGSKERR